jgi:TetR/AcrR family transcriptional regulator
LFAQNGFKGTTTKMIAVAAGVTEALIFRYFPSKEALYEAILWWRVREAGAEEWIQQIQSYVERRDDEQLFRELIKGKIEFHRQNPDFQRLMLYSALEGHDLAFNFREKLFRPIHDMLVDYIRLRQREGAFRAVNPEAAVQALVSLPAHHTLTTSLFKCSMAEISDEEAVEQFTRIILEGLRRQSGGAARTEGE